MSVRQWSRGDIERIERLRQEGKSWTQVAVGFGFSRTEKNGELLRAAWRRGKKLLDKPPVQEPASDEPRKKEHDVQAGTTSVEANRPFSKEELAEIFGLDMSEWRCIKFLSNTWGDNWQSKAWWEPIVANMIANRWDELVEGAEEEAFAIFDEQQAPDMDGLLYEINISDAHIGALSWGPEAGEDWDTDIGLEMYSQAMGEFIERAPEKGIKRVMLVLGNDLFHVDQLIHGSGGATTKGTPQDVDTRWQKLFVHVCEHIAAAIELLHVALDVPVDVVVVPGNHDRRVTYYLGEWLSARFSGHGDIRVDNSPRPRKYYRWGECTIGLAHGDREKPQQLYGLMTEEAGVTTFREWHLGHNHMEEMKEWGTVRIRYMPALFPGDAWHAEQGYRSLPGARAFVWHPTRGMVQMLAHNPVPKQRRTNTGPTLKEER